MTVIDVQTDPVALTLTVTSTFTATVERVWQIWADPRQLERWWGPPTYPAKVVEHNLTPGGSVTYFMTGPGGDQHHGWWRIEAVEAPQMLELTDGFADATGTPNLDMPVTRMKMTLRQADEQTTEMVVTSAFPSAEAFEQLIAMGMLEGMREAANQIDGILAA
jgi:uncharacterized protein YndB with AHSA1/START domain